MTVAPITPRRLWYHWIPKSWYAVDSGSGGSPSDSRNDRNDHRIYRDRDRERDIDLDDTRSFRSRRYDDQPPAPKVQVPFGVIITIMIYLIGQLVGGVWWAATLQSNLQHEIADRAKEEMRLWDSIQAYRAEVNALRLDIARSSAPPNRRTSKDDEDE